MPLLTNKEYDNLVLQLQLTVAELTRALALLDHHGIHFADLDEADSLKVRERQLQLTRNWLDDNGYDSAVFDEVTETLARERGEG